VMSPPLGVRAICGRGRVEFGLFRNLDDAVIRPPSL
jgi:hypothetical protein